MLGASAPSNLQARVRAVQSISVSCMLTVVIKETLRCRPRRNLNATAPAPRSNAQVEEVKLRPGAGAKGGKGKKAKAAGGGEEDDELALAGEGAEGEQVGRGRETTFGISRRTKGKAKVKPIVALSIQRTSRRGTGNSGFPSRMLYPAFKSGELVGEGRGRGGEGKGIGKGWESSGGGVEVGCG